MCARLPLAILRDGLDGLLDSALDGLVLHALLDEFNQLLGELVAGEGLSDGAHEELGFGCCGGGLGSLLGVAAALAVGHCLHLLFITKINK